MIIKVCGMRDVENIRAVVLHDLSRQQHAEGLAANHARSHHAGVDLEIILRSEVAFDKLPHPRVPRQHDVADPTALRTDIEPVFEFDLCALEEALPAIPVFIVGLR